jgi:hypothetical protein
MTSAIRGSLTPATKKATRPGACQLPSLRGFLIFLDTFVGGLFAPEFLTPISNFEY